MKEKTGGLICEFNPLHLGHKIILDKMRSEGAVVLVMSGNFVQRGDTAIADKWTRARCALESGADLVLELPLPTAVSRAETFAMGGVTLLASLNVVDELWFGSECGDTDSLKKIQNIIESPDFNQAFKAHSQNGMSFAAARECAVAEIMGDDYGGELKGSNNNLGIEYIGAIKRINSPILPRTVTRRGAAHDSESTGEVISAMQIRSLIKEGGNFAKYLPEHSAKAIEGLIESGFCPSRITALETAILAKLRTLEKHELSSLPDLSEGLENKLYKSIRRAKNLEELYDLVKSKRYSHARVRRLVLHAFLGVRADMQYVPYIHVLAMNQRGADILKNSKKTLPVIGKASDVKKLSKDAQRIFELEARADDIYALSSPVIRPCGLTFTTKLIKS